MTKFFNDFLRDESGAAASEYILLLALLGGGVALGAYQFGGKIKDAFGVKGSYLTACAADKTATAC